MPHRRNEESQITRPGLIVAVVSCRVLPELKSPKVEVKQKPPPPRVPSPARPPPDGQSVLPAALTLCCISKGFISEILLLTLCANLLQIPPTQTSCPTSGGLGAQSEETYDPGTDY